MDNHIALTCDAGPHPEFTPKILGLLAEHKAKATFFCIGREIEKHPAIFKAIIDAGHTVGNHTYSHSKSFGFFNTEKVIQELQKETNTTIVINEDPVTEEGIVEILGTNQEGIDAVLAKIDSLLLFNLRKVLTQNLF